jgi:hypothetical protein
LTPRTLAPAPPQDRRYWRLLLKRTHPDTGGSEDLFVWTQHLREYIAGDAPEEPPPQARHQPPPHPSSGDRIEFSGAFERFGSFSELTAVILAKAADMPEPFASLFAKLDDCAEVGEYDPVSYRMQHEGATYRSLAALAHKAGFSKEQRVRFYRLAEDLCLSQRHCGHLHKKLAGREE